MHRTWIIAGCLAGFASVAGGAFGAHALADRLEPDLLQTFQTGARYAMLHASALLATGLLAALPGPSRRALLVAGIAFCLGLLLFTGSLWTLALTGQRWLGAITPLGGLSFLVGWTALGTSVIGWRSRD